MSELFDSKTHFSSLLICDLILLFSFLLSHPLYFSYFIFFSPYLIKLISFLSPLFITTFLLFLALFTAIVRENFPSPKSKQSSLLLLILEKLRSHIEDEDKEVHCFQNLEMYEIVFGSSLMETKGSQDEVLEGKIEESTTLEASGPTMIEGTTQDAESTTLQKSEPSMNGGPIHEDPISRKGEGMKIEGNSSPVHSPEQDNININKCVEKEEKRMENFLKILDEFERMSSNVEEKKKFRRPMGSNADKVVEKQKEERNGSKAEVGNINITNKSNNDNYKNNTNNNKISSPATVSVDSIHDDDDRKEYNPIVKAHSQRITSSKKDGENLVKFESSRNLSQNLGSYGSMRKEKEWKRTLACKLFEERHNVDGGDGMDSLWETYDQNDSVKSKSKNLDKKNKKKEVEECEEEEEDIDDGQLCCLQALKLSAGKVNLGMGRPNLLKITKAIKEFGWLHHVSKHSKKVHNHGDHRY